jgi:5'-3' exonuclease
MGNIAISIKDKIFKKYEKELKNEENRYAYEKNKIDWKTTNITPGTKFMHKLNNTLSGSKFEVSIKKICKNIKTYIFSGPYEPGEGENKIVNYMRSMKQEKSNYLIYSPDSDVTLLALILNCSASPIDKRKVSNLSLLRQNQQKNQYDVVDIDKLANNIYDYVTKNIDTSSVPIKDNIINDVVFILTIFGNDFVPKIESLNVRYDFDRIIDKYIDVIKENFTANKFKYLIEYSQKNNKKILNYQIFLSLIKLLQIDEGGNLQKIYMSSHYKNYNRLKKLFGADQTNFTFILNEFLDKLRKFNSGIRSIKNNSDQQKNILVEDLLKKWKNDVNFLSQLKRLTQLSSSRNISDKDFILAYAEYYIRQNKIPKVMVTFHRFPKSIKDDFHKRNIEKSVDRIDPKLKITRYDEELYAFEHMLDDYNKKLNAGNLKLGYISVDPNTYTFKTDKIVKSVSQYYDDFFGIKNISTNNPKLKKLIDNYFEGLVWVFEYYYNKFDENYHRDYANVWYYKYSHAPLLTQIYHHLKEEGNGYINKITNNLNVFKVERPNYFNSLEHLMYVSPNTSLIELAPKEYLNFVKTYGYYKNVDDIVKDIWEKSSSDEIDCRGILFMSKCHLKVVSQMQDFEKDTEYINQLRKIELNPDTIKRRSIYYKHKSNINVFNYYKITTLDNVKKKIPGKNKMFASGESYDTNLKIYYKYKAKYLETGDKKYKLVYKHAKELTH